jgi:Na+/H+ antiporter NhaC
MKDFLWFLQFCIVYVSYIVDFIVLMYYLRTWMNDVVTFAMLFFLLVFTAFAIEPSIDKANKFNGRQ